MRTAADFDQPYRKPDPWDVLRLSVRDNVLRTIAEKYGAGKRILEFGCGEGQHTQMLASIGLSVLAVDISQAALGRARARNSRRHNSLPPTWSDLRLLKVWTS